MQQTHDDLENKYATFEEQNILLSEETVFLQTKISQQENKLVLLKDYLSNQQNNNEITEGVSEVTNTNSNNGNNISIFDLNTFRGNVRCKTALPKVIIRIHLIINMYRCMLPVIILGQ